MMIYQWAALSTDLNAVPVTLGISDDRDRARAAAAEAVLDGRAFVAVVEAVRPVTGTVSAVRCYVSCGPMWHGRRTAAGAVRWDQLTGAAQ